MVAFSKIPPLGLVLSRKDIHIWRAPLDLPTKNIQELSQTLSVDERMRAGLFYFEQDRKRFIARRGILRKILGSYIGIEPNSLEFCYGKNGKPALANLFGKGDIRFSLSHSEGVALYGFTRDREIGVDIEYIRDIREMDQIAEQFFSRREMDFFRALPESNKKKAFFSYWTLKEAFVKAVGDGLSRPLDHFDVSVAPGRPARLLRIEGDPKGPSRWSIQDLKPPSGFAAGFAVEGQSWRLNCWQWSG